MGHDVYCCVRKWGIPQSPTFGQSHMFHMLVVAMIDNPLLPTASYPSIDDL